ncbi:MAG: hypothetical protein V4690_03395 [Patescibacteria group bacterium]
MYIKDKIINTLRDHVWAFTLSVLVGFVMVFPQVITVVNLGEEYNGIYIMKMDAEEHYLARMQEFLDFRSLNNPFLFEGKGLSPSSSFTISESLLSLPLVFGVGSVPSVNLIYKFILPIILCLAFYFLMFRITQDKLWSLGFSITTILGYTVLTSSGIKDILFFNFQNFPANMYARPVNPAFSSIFFVGYLHLLLSVFRKPSNKLSVALALFLGFSFYIYFYTFTFFIAINVVCFILFLLCKRNRDAFGIVAAMIAGILIGSLAIINLVKLLLHENYVYLAPISNVVNSRTPVFSVLGVLVLVIFGIYMFFKWREKGVNEYFLTSTLLTAFVVINQQVITGISVQEGHYHWYFNTPIYIMVLFWVGHKLFEKRYKFLYLSIPIIFIVLSFIVSISGQYNFYNDWSSQVFKEQRYANVFQWLNENSEKNDVVLANNELSLKIPAYTTTDVSWNYFTLAYLTPVDRTKYALFLYLRLNGVKPTDIKNESYFHPPVVNKPETKNNRGYEYEEVNILLRDYMTGIYPDGMKKMYEDFYNKPWEEIFGMYKLDYLVWDQMMNPNWSFNEHLFEQVYTGVDLVIYKVK